MAVLPENLPSTPHREYAAALADVTLGRDLLAGTRVIQTKKADYLLKFPKETEPKFDRRAKAAKLYGGLSRTLSASVGMLFAKPPALPDILMPGGIWAEHWANIDLANTAGTVLMKRFAESCVADGFGALVVDFPPVPDGVRVTAADEGRLNLRPFWRLYNRLDIISWRLAVIDNAIQPVQVVLRESAESDLGSFASAAQVQYRVLRLVRVVDTATQAARHVATWEVLVEESGTAGRGVKRIDGGFFRGRTGAPLSRLPLAIGYGGRTDAPFTARPPLLDVAWSNLYYYRKETTLNYNEELCAFPMIHTKGRVADAKGNAIPLEFGPSTHIETRADGDVKWVELEGTGSALLTVSLAREKRDMAELGMSFLAGDTRAAETAEAKRLDATAENATLSSAATGIEDAINMALVFHAEYEGVDSANAPSVTINRDFESVVMDAPTMLAYVTAVEKVGLDPMTLLDAWQRGGRIPQDADLDQMYADMLANAVKIADAAADAAEAQVASAGMP